MRLPGLEGRGEERIDLGLDRDVHHHRDCVAACHTDRFGGLSGPGGIDVARDHPRALAGVADRDRPPDAAAGAGHDGVLLTESHDVVLVRNSVDGS